MRFRGNCFIKGEYILNLIRKIITTLVGSLFCISSINAQTQQVIKMTAASAHPQFILWVKVLDEYFIPEVDKRLIALGGHYKIDWTKAYGGSLVKIGAESNAMRDGISDIGFIGTVFEAAKFPLQNVTFYAPFGADDPAVVTSAIELIQKNIPQVQDAWTKNGLVYLAGAGIGGYQIFTKFPIVKFEDLKGKKIAAPGPSANWIKNTGGVAVAGSLNSYYEDIKSGVSDGALTFYTGAWSVKLHEVAPYITRVNFGSQNGGSIAINKNKFDKLPQEVKKVFLDVGVGYSVEFAKLQKELGEQQLQQMIKLGAKLTDLSETERGRWASILPSIGKTWMEDLKSNGLPSEEVMKLYITTIRSAGAKVPRDWSKE